jgi:DNA-3-methyladenine glycosylase
MPVSRLQPVPFDRHWYARHPLRVAFDLVGSTIVVERDGTRVAARIVEVEAYGGLEDGASHATMYRVGRETLLNPAGVLYMQLSYGLHTMTNIVAHEAGGLGAVLLRAAEDPIEGYDLARSRRQPLSSGFLVGPGNFSRGMGTTLADTLSPLDTEHGVYLLPGEPVAEVRASARIGISRATDALWRLFDGNSRSVSKSRRGAIITRSDVDELVTQLDPES